MPKAPTRQDGTAVTPPVSQWGGRSLPTRPITASTGHLHPCKQYARREQGGCRERPYLSALFLPTAGRQGPLFISELWSQGCGSGTVRYGGAVGAVAESKEEGHFLRQAMK